MHIFEKTIKRIIFKIKMIKVVVTSVIINSVRAQGNVFVTHKKMTHANNK
jgi:hypothetical protein